MFSNEKRCYYSNNQLAEVICQLRFPEILTIGTNVPAAFQDAIRGDFPRYSVRNEAPAPRISGTPGNLQLENQSPTVNYQFASADGSWRVNLTTKFISLSTNHYSNWESFAKKLDTPLAAFIKTYNPAFFERVGLRYMNFFSRKSLSLEGTAFRDLIQPAYLGILAEDDVNEASCTRCSMDAEIALNGGCRAKIHAGPGLVKRNNQPDPEVKFILDLDLFMGGNIPVNYSAASLETLHAQAYPVFRDAITDNLHSALEPDI